MSLERSERSENPRLKWDFAQILTRILTKLRKKHGLPDSTHQSTTVQPNDEYAKHSQLSREPATEKQILALREAVEKIKTLENKLAFLDHWYQRIEHSLPDILKSLIPTYDDNQITRFIQIIYTKTQIGLREATALQLYGQVLCDNEVSDGEVIGRFSPVNVKEQIDIICKSLSAGTLDGSRYSIEFDRTEGHLLSDWDGFYIAECVLRGILENKNFDEMLKELMSAELGSVRMSALHARCIQGLFEDYLYTASFPPLVAPHAKRTFLDSLLKGIRFSLSGMEFETGVYPGIGLDHESLVLLLPLRQAVYNGRNAMAEVAISFWETYLDSIELGSSISTPPAHWLQFPDRPLRNDEILFYLPPNMADLLGQINETLSLKQLFTGKPLYPNLFAVLADIPENRCGWNILRLSDDVPVKILAQTRLVK